MKKVIIVDDEPIVVNGLNQLVQWHDYGFEVAGTAYDGGQALELIRTLRPDLVFTDIRMPGLNGIELISRAKRISPGTRFVIFSAYNDFEYIHSALRLNVFDYVDKPVTVEKLQGILTAYMRAADAEPAPEEGIRGILEESLDADREAESVARHAARPVTQQQGLRSFFCCEIMLGRAEEREYAMNALAAVSRAHGMKMIAASRRDALLAALYADEMNADTEGCLDALRDVCDQLELKGCDAHAGVSDLYSDDAELPYATAEARKAAEFARFYDESFVRISEIPGQSDGAEPIFSAVFEQSVAAAMCAADTEKVEELVRGFLDELAVRSTSVDLFRHEALGLVYLCHRIARDMDILQSVPSQFPHVEIQKYHSIETLADWVCSQFAQATLALQFQQNTRLTKSVQPARSYIDQYYMRAITLEELASLCGMSPSYFSFLFKAQVGQTYVKYINQVRMERARDMLKSGLSVRRISENVGFINQRYFSDRFKAYWGCTPTQMRLGEAGEAD